MSYDISSRRVAAQSREMARYLDMQPRPAEVCACGKRKPAKCLVCKSCWFSAPAELRKSYFCASSKERRAAARLILEAARQRKTNTNMNPTTTTDNGTPRSALTPTP